MIKYEELENEDLSGIVDDAFLIEPCSRCLHRWSAHHVEEAIDLSEMVQAQMRWCTGGGCQCYGYSSAGVVNWNGLMLNAA